MEGYRGKEVLLFREEGDISRYDRALPAVRFLCVVCLRDEPCIQGTVALSDKIKDGSSSSSTGEEVHRQGEKTMKLWKFNSVKFTFLMTVMETLMTIYLMSKLSTLVTDDLDTLKKNVLILLGLYLTERGLQYFKLYSQQVSSYYI